MITIKKGDIIKLDSLYWEVISRGKNTCIVKFGDRERVVLKKDIKLVVGKEIQLFKLKQAIYYNDKHIKNNSWQETRQERKRINKLLERKIKEIREELKCL